MQPSLLRYLFKLAILAVLYFGATKIGFIFSFTIDEVLLIWPPTGIALAVLLLFGYQLWPGIFMGTFLALTSTDASLGFALAAATGVSLEALTGAYLLHRVGFDNALARVRDVVSLIILAALLSGMLNTTVSVIGLGLSHMIPWSAYLSVWWVWWQGDVLAVLVTTPLLLTWGAKPTPTGWSTWQWVEAVGMLLAGVVISLAAFSGWFGFGPANLPIAYLPFPILIWAALRFGPVGAATISPVINAIAVWGTLHGFGPFAVGSLNANLFLMYTFVGVVSITVLVLAAITAERQQAEATLAQREDAYRTLVENSLQGTLVIQAGRIVFANTAITKISGYALNELYALSPTEVASLIHPDDQSQVLQAIQDHLSGKKVSPRLEYRFTRKTGEICWILTSTSFIEYQDKPATQIIYLDITERVQVEEHLRTERNFSNAIIDSLPGIFYLINEQGEFLHWNHNLEAISGYSAAEILSMHPLDFLAENEKEKGEQALQTAFSTGEVALEINFTTRYNRLIPYFFTGRRIKLEQTTGIVGTGIDISEQKAIEISLRISEARYRAIIEDQTELISRTKKDGTLIFVNDAYCRYFGIPREVLIGQKFQQFLPEESLRAAQQKRDNLTPENPVAYDEHQEFRSDGTLRWINWTNRGFFDEAGQLIEVQVVGRDVTERKQAEEEIYRLNKDLELRVRERTAELRQTVNLMAGREVRMAELKEVIRRLQAQLEEAGLSPVTQDPLTEV